MVYVSSSGDITSMIFSSSMVSHESPSGTKLSILSPAKPTYYGNKYLIEYSPEGSVWNVNANELGYLSSSVLGDIQIGLYDTNQVSFQTSDIFAGLMIVLFPAKCLNRVLREA